MRYLKYLVLLAFLAVPAIHAQAQVAIGVQIGPTYGYYNAPPVCEFGYYPYYPFACAPYGYWGPEWFVEGVFIGAGPWDHFYFRHPDVYERFGLFRSFHGEAFRGDRFRGFRDRDDFRGRTFHGDEAVRVNPGFRGGESFRGNGNFRGNESFRGNGNFRGGESFHGNGNFRGGESFHGHENGGRSFRNNGGNHGDHGRR